jgi:hypothetical protein
MRKLRRLASCSLCVVLEAASEADADLKCSRDAGGMGGICMNESVCKSCVERPACKSCGGVHAGCSSGKHCA